MWERFWLRIGVCKTTNPTKWCHLVVTNANSFINVNWNTIYLKELMMLELHWNNIRYKVFPHGWYVCVSVARMLKNSWTMTTLAIVFDVTTLFLLYKVNVAQFVACICHLQVWAYVIVVNLGKEIVRLSDSFNLPSVTDTLMSDPFSTDQARSDTSGRSLTAECVSVLIALHSQSILRKSLSSWKRGKLSQLSGGWTSRAASMSAE